MKASHVPARGQQRLDQLVIHLCRFGRPQGQAPAVLEFVGVEPSPASLKGHVAALAVILTGAMCVCVTESNGRLAFPFLSLHAYGRQTLSSLARIDILVSKRLNALILFQTQSPTSPRMRG